MRLSFVQGTVNPGQAGGTTTGFSPAAGYSFSVTGAPAFEQQFTVTVTDGRFGANGPTLVIFDDFRGGTVGNTIANNTPGVAGNYSWLNTIGNNGNLLYATPNRSGSGQCARIRGNGDGDTFFRNNFLSFANTNGIYCFWAENSHGTDYGALTGAGTGNAWNYKLLWFLFNGQTANAFNIWLNDILGTSQGFGGNSSPPLPSWSSGSGASYDQNNWTSVEEGYVGDPNNPTTAPGIMLHSEWCPRNGGQHGAKSTASNPLGATTNVLFNSGSGSAGTYAFGNSLSVPGLIEGAPSTLVVDRADFYCAIGPNCLNRFLIGNAPTLGACTSIMPCTIVSWGANAVTMVLRAGAFTAPAPNYLYWSDQSNNISLVGQFTTPFDFFISTTGSDSNPGTLAQPWAITSLVPTSSNQSKMAGKKIGLMAGTYSTTGLPQSANAFAYSILTIPDGTSAATPTYLASCDTNGNYAARKAIINGPGGVCPNGILGNKQSDTSQYITIDGIVIDGNGTVANSVGGGHHIHFYSVSYSRSSSNNATIPGIVVKNCELRNMNPQGSNSYLGGNYAFVFMAGCIAPVIQNNLMHDMLYSGTSANDPSGVAVSHQGATCMIGCQNSLATLNTIYNCTMGIWDKEGNTGSTVSYNYIYNTAIGGITNISGYNSAIIGFDGQAGNPNPGPAPTTQTFHHNVIEACGPAHVFVENFQTASFIPCVGYNNTVYETTTAGQRGWSMNTTQGAAQFYNNIYVSTGPSSGSAGATYQGKLSLNSGNFTAANVSNNCYHSVGATTNWWQLVTGGSTALSSTLAAWQTASGADTASITSDPSFQLPGGYTLGAGASQFQLNAGSPCLTSGVGGAAMGALDGSGPVGCNFTTGN